MQERIKFLRKKLDLTQEEFAGRLGIKRGAIANYELGRNEPIDAVIKLICTTFDVDEKWLRTGEGQPFRVVTRNTQLTSFFADVLADEPESFRHKLCVALSELTVDEWQIAEKFIRNLTEK